MNGLNLFSATQKFLSLCLISPGHRRTLLWLDDERAFQPACQSITLMDSPVCLSDSGWLYFISADVLPLAHSLCAPNGVHFLVRTKCLCRVLFRLVLLAQHNQHHCVSGGDGCYGTAGQAWRTVCRHWLFTLEASQKENCDQMHLYSAVYMFYMRHQPTAYLWHVCSYSRSFEFFQFQSENCLVFLLKIQ